MKSRLLYLVLAAALVAAAFTALTLPAAAEPRTITVRLMDGTVITVTVDVPPGTPLDDIDLPPMPAPVDDIVSIDEGADIPPPNDPTLGATEEPPAANRAEESRPASRGKSRRKKRARRKGRPEMVVEAEAPLRRLRRGPRAKLRNADGSPDRRNPTFFDALPGPAPVGVPNFVIRKFRVPIFLLPIYQAAGIQYGVRWEILAAINEIETDYGRNLNVSSAGAVGWMQFLPSSWKAYGVDANKDGRKDPYNPVDAIFAAGRYLKAAGAEKDIKRAIFAYNHADWYVDSVMLRARLISGVPGDLVGSLTGLTEGRFPVYARARYADDLSEREAEKRFRRGQNAARVVDGDGDRRGIEIYARKGAPAVAVNDGVIKRIGQSERLGRYIVLQDAYGNRYTYAGLDRVSRHYPVPKEDAGEVKTEARAISARDATAADTAPAAPASAGRQVDVREDAGRGATRRAERVPAHAPRVKVAVKDRLFAHPERPGSRRAGGADQILNSRRSVRGFTTFRNYFSRPFGVHSRDVRLKRLTRGSRVIGGTILGRVGKRVEEKASHLYFEIRPAGRGAPRIDPKPILDGWKLLESTAIYRASGRNALLSDGDDDDFSIGQILLLPKSLLERRVLSDERIDIYDCGRRDISSGQVDRRVLATLAYLAESGLRPTVTSLKCGHSFYTSSGNVSHHSSGNAVDIAQINGVPILGHQEPGGITEQTVTRLLRLQGTVQPDQIISLLEMGGPTYAMADHADHIHVGFRPLFGTNRKLGQQAFAVLKPGQWDDLLDRLREIDNPVVPTKPSEFSIPVRKRSSLAHRGE